MNCYYTEYIPTELANELGKLGMTIYRSAQGESETTYADSFDWLLGKGIIVMIVPSNHPSIYDGTNGKEYDKIHGYISYANGRWNTESATWHEAANRAIENAIYLLKHKS